FLRKLPLGPLRLDRMMLCHGSPHNEDEYVFTEMHAARIFIETDANLVLFGHTHLPAIFWMDRENFVSGAAVQGDATIPLNPEYRYLINPGSVGQPRDRNPQSSFAIVDSKKGTAQFFRVGYDVRKTQSASLKAGL